MTKSSTDIANAVCRAVAELVDRSSPEDWPEAMLVTADELHSITLDALATVEPVAIMRISRPAPGTREMDFDHPLWGDLPDGEHLLYRAAAQAPTLPAFQDRVQPWLLACFGEMIAGDREERNHRFLEEALELVQACGCSASEAHQLVDYVFGRPVGQPAQEVGGVMVTLAALCLANGLDMHDAAEVELARIWTMVEKIRAKQAAKPKHSPLPEAALPQLAAPAVAWRERMGPKDAWKPCSKDHHDWVLRAPAEWPGVEVQALAVVCPRPPQETNRDWTQAQAWAGMDSATAYWLIQRHADGWGDAGAMMEAWRAANTPPALTHAQRLDLAAEAFTIAARKDPTCVVNDADEERVLTLLSELSGIPLTGDEGAAHGQPT